MCFSFSAIKLCLPTLNPHPLLQPNPIWSIIVTLLRHFSRVVSWWCKWESIKNGGKNVRTSLWTVQLSLSWRQLSLVVLRKESWREERVSYNESTIEQLKTIFHSSPYRWGLRYFSPTIHLELSADFFQDFSPLRSSKQLKNKRYSHQVSASLSSFNNVTRTR